MLDLTVARCDSVRLGDGPSGSLDGNANRLRYTADYYSDLFTSPECSWVNSPNEKRGLTFNRRSPRLPFRVVCD